jgi:hypothetical protein
MSVVEAAGWLAWAVVMAELGWLFLRVAGFV